MSSRVGKPEGKRRRRDIGTQTERTRKRPVKNHLRDGSGDNTLLPSRVYWMNFEEFAVGIGKESWIMIGHLATEQDTKDNM
eukprot:767121-Hanusia_phi.AAC.1